MYFTLIAHLTLIATFEVLNRHRWLVVTTLNGAALEVPPLTSLGGRGVERDRSWPTGTITTD